MSDLSKILTDKITAAVSSSVDEAHEKINRLQNVDLGPILRSAIRDALESKENHRNE